MRKLLGYNREALAIVRRKNCGETIVSHAPSVLGEQNELVTREMRLSPGNIGQSKFATERHKLLSTKIKLLCIKCIFLNEYK